MAVTLEQTENPDVRLPDQITAPASSRGRTLATRPSVTMSSADLRSGEASRAMILSVLPPQATPRPQLLEIG